MHYIRIYYTTSDRQVGYNYEYCGEGIENCFYLADTETDDGGNTMTQSENGEAAYLLQVREKIMKFCCMIWIFIEICIYFSQNFQKDLKNIQK